MYLGNFLKAGDFLTVVPVGIPTTLQYNAEGLIEKVYSGFQDERKQLSQAFVQMLVHKDIAPAKISIKQGTTWVRGVLYTSNRSFASGILPDCVIDDLVDKFLHTSSKFNFFAGSLESLAAQFKGAVPIRQWLSMAGFKLLPGWMVPSDLSKESFNKMVNTDRYPFVFPLIASYIVYHMTNISYVANPITQFTLSKVVRYTDSYGNIKARIYNKEDGSFRSIDYTDVVAYNLNANSFVVFDTDGDLVYSISTDGKVRDKRSSKVSCSHCGKVFTLPKSGLAQCPDTHCPSMLYPQIGRFLAVTNLPTYGVERIQEWIANKKVTTVPDLFTLEEYAEQTVSLTLAQLLSSLIPTTYISKDFIYAVFANQCSNNIKTFHHYVNNPDKISGDLGIKHSDLGKLVDWLSDGYNASDVNTLLETPQIQIDLADQKFDGAPIFRNKTIFITGKFIRGTLSEIASILQSYDARVILSYSDDADCVIIGDANEDTDGRSVKIAKNSGIPIYQETVFFRAYEIDEDMKENLL